jgi:hypothetical protein
LLPFSPEPFVFSSDAWVFENRALRRIFGPKKDEVTGGCRELHNEELHNLYPSPSIIRIVKSMRMIWIGNVA